jgi:hypothetical protein
MKYLITLHYQSLCVPVKRKTSYDVIEPMMLDQALDRVKDGRSMRLMKRLSTMCAGSRLNKKYKTICLAQIVAWMPACRRHQNSGCTPNVPRYCICYHTDNLSTSISDQPIYSDATERPVLEKATLVGQNHVLNSKVSG